MNTPAALTIREIEFDPDRRDYTTTHRAMASGLLLSNTGRIILQRRPDDADGAPGMLGLFGTVQEPGETFLDTGGRALWENLGIRLDPGTVQLLGALEVVQGKVLSLSARYFWPIVSTPALCREGKIETYRNGAEIMALPNLTKCAAWAIGRAMRNGLIQA